MAIRNTQGKTNIMSPLGSLVSIPCILRPGYALCSCSITELCCIPVSFSMMNRVCGPFQPKPTRPGHFSHFFKAESTKILMKFAGQLGQGQNETCKCFGQLGHNKLIFFCMFKLLKVLMCIL